MNRREVWKQVYQRFDVLEPALPSWHADRLYSPLERMKEQLSLDELRLGRFSPRPRLLLLGTMGSGKSTELDRLAQQQGHDFVHQLDMWVHFTKVAGNESGLDTVAPWEIIFLVGLTLYQAAIERLEFSWPPYVLEELEKAYQEAAGASRVDAPRSGGSIELNKLAKTALAAVKLVAGSTNPIAGGAIALAEPLVDSIQGHFNLPIGHSRQKLADDTAPSRRLLRCVNDILRSIEDQKQRVLLIIDGLDRVRLMDRIRALFVESSLLGQLQCPVVVCGPFAIRHHPSVAEVKGFDPYILANEPVVRVGKDGLPELGEGYSFLRDLFGKRVRDLAEPSTLVDERLLQDLALYSGGRARDFVKLIQRVASKVLLKKGDVATPEMVEEAIEEARRDLELGLHAGHIAVLQEVLDDERHKLPATNDYVWELLVSSRLLPYPNRSEWYYPHPLLTRNLVRPSQQTPRPPG